MRHTLVGRFDHPAAARHAARLLHASGVEPRCIHVEGADAPRAGDWPVLLDRAFAVLFGPADDGPDSAWPDTGVFVHVDTGDDPPQQERARAVLRDAGAAHVHGFDADAFAA